MSKITPEGERLIAKQWTMYETDERFSTEWIKTMHDLVKAHLDDKTFTERRMAALRDWERRRKLEQAHIHYRFDLGRRTHRLVDRDTKKVLDLLKTKIIEQQRADAERARLQKLQDDLLMKDDF
jgi:transcriptional regulator of heat shock response